MGLCVNLQIEGAMGRHTDYRENNFMYTSEKMLYGLFFGPFWCAVVAKVYALMTRYKLLKPK